MEHKPIQNVFLQEIRAYWKRITLSTLLGLACGIAYALFAPKWYTSQLTVVPTTAPKSGGIGLQSAAAAGLADLPIDLGGSADVERVAAIFRSNSVTDAVIAKFGLKARYEVKYLEDARKELWRNCSIKTEKKSTLVILECEDKSPEVANNMLVYFAEQANEVARRVATSSAGEERKFLEKRVVQARGDLDNASRNLREFQEKNKVVNLPAQAQAIVTSMATIRAEMLEKQLQLSYVDGFSSSEESTSEQLRRQVGLLKAKLKSLEETRVASGAPAPSRPGSKVASSNDEGPDSIFPPAMIVPKLQYELEQLIREQKIQETLVLLLSQRFESARINEARDTSTIQVLDYPVRATKQSSPKRVASVAVGALFGLLIAVGWVRFKSGRALTRPAAVST